VVVVATSNSSGTTAEDGGAGNFILEIMMMRLFSIGERELEGNSVWDWCDVRTQKKSAWFAARI
jgi:hypothetical protein